MDERNAHAADVDRAVRTASSAVHDPPGDKWKLEGGTDLEGQGLTVVISFDAGYPRVVTVF
jgi:hypothetical protein